MTTGTAPEAPPEAVHARASRAFGWSFGNTVAANQRAEATLPS